MTSERLARIVAASLARHQARGLVDDATGLADVVIHGRVDLLAVANDIFAASARELKPAKRSWAAWFVCKAEDRRDARRREEKREQLVRRLESGPTCADQAIARLRLRKLG